MGRAKEAVFWVSELIRSDCAVDAIYSMIYAWAFSIGPLRLEWYRRAWEVFRRDSVEGELIVQYAYSLAGSISSQMKLEKGVTEETTFTNTKDTTALLLCLCEPNVTDKSPILLRDFHKVKQEGWKGLEKRAGADGRLRQFLSALQRVDQCVGEFYAERLSVIMFAIGFLAVSGGSAIQKAESWRSIILRELSPEMKEWLEDKGGVHRADRVFEIPYMCLYGMTERGAMPQQETTLGELRARLEECLMESDWWSQRIKEHYGGDIRGNDSMRERFYDTEFPEDIPDEWSLADQQKSHGGGAAIEKEGPSVARTLERWFAIERSAWWKPADARDAWRSVRGAHGLEKRLGF